MIWIGLKAMKEEAERFYTINRPERKNLKLFCLLIGQKNFEKKNQGYKTNCWIIGNRFFHRKKFKTCHLDDLW